MPTLDANDLSVPERVDALVRLQRIASRVAALEAELLVSLVGASPVNRDVVVLDRVTDSERTLTLTDEMREEVALAMRRSPGQVRDQVDRARLLANYLPATRAALKEGWLSAQHARVICEQATRLRDASDLHRHVVRQCLRAARRAGGRSGRGPHRVEDPGVGPADGRGDRPGCGSAAANGSAS